MCTDPYLQGDQTVTRSRSQTPMSRKRKRAASSGARSLSRPPRDQSGIGSPEVKNKTTAVEYISTVNHARTFYSVSQPGSSPACIVCKDFFVSIEV